MPAWYGSIGERVRVGTDLRASSLRTSVPTQPEQSTKGLDDWRIYVDAKLIGDYLAVHLDEHLRPGKPVRQEAYARLSTALPDTSGRCLAPCVTIPGVGRCRKCNGQQVLLVGTPPRARRWVCPSCNEKPFKAHLARWEQLGGRPFNPGIGGSA